jgi:hypothetical protein
MPVLCPLLANPTDVVIQGEQLRMSVYDREPEVIGTVINGGPIVGFDSTLSDEDNPLPMNNYVDIGGPCVVRRSKSGELQMRANAGIATPCGAWVWNDWSPLVSRILFSTDTFTISGTSRDNTGAALAGCEVRVFDGSNAFIGQVISDGSGNWSLSVPTNSGPFWARYYLAGSPNRAGATDYFLVP